MTDASEQGRFSSAQAQPTAGCASDQSGASFSSLQASADPAVDQAADPAADLVIDHVVDHVVDHVDVAAKRSGRSLKWEVDERVGGQGEDLDAKWGGEQGNEWDGSRMDEGDARWSGEQDGSRGDEQGDELDARWVGGQGGEQGASQGIDAGGPAGVCSTADPGAAGGVPDLPSEVQSAPEPLGQVEAHPLDGQVFASGPPTGPSSGPPSGPSSGSPTDFDREAVLPPVLSAAVPPVLPDVIPAWIAEHDLGPPQAVRSALRRLAELPDVGYTRRSEELGRAFAAWAGGRYAWRPDPDLVVPTSDVLQGIWACVSAFSEPGDGVVLSPPVYPPFFDVCPSLGRSAYLWPLRRSSDGWLHDTDELADLLAANPDCRVLLLCSPQNPTGRVYDLGSLERIVGLAAEHDLVVVSDEIHADLVYQGFRHRPFLSVPGAAERSAALFSPGKSFAVSGLRTAVVVFGSEEMRARFTRRMPRHLLGDVSRAGSEAAIVAWESCENWLDSLLELLGGHRRRIGEVLAEFPEVVYHPPEATFLAWLDLSRTGLGHDPAETLLREARLRLSPGGEFGDGGAGHVRLNFGTSSALLEEMLRRLTALFNASAGE